MHAAGPAGPSGPVGPANGRDANLTKRIDLHLHSYASGKATNWWVKVLGLGGESRESYTPPAEAHRMARAAGMDFVTLTDHETIDGGLTLLDRADFLPGVEVSAVFPEGGSSVDILVYGLDPAQHAEIQARRGDVYGLVDYLREERLVHVLAHPMFESGGPLDRAGVEKRLVLFGLWELVNGSRPANQNRLAERVAAGAGPGELRQLARRHGLRIPPHTRIAGTGGSDDHGGVYIGATYSLVPAVTGVPDLLAAMAAGEMRPGGADGSVEKMAHTGFRIAGFASTTPAAGETAGDRTAGERDGGSVGPGSGANEANGSNGAGGAGAPAGSGLGAMVGQAARAAQNPQSARLREYLPLLASLGGEQIRGLLAGQYERRVADALGNAGSGFPALGMLGSVGSFVDGHLFVAPYVAMHGYFGRERQKTRTLRRQLFPAAAAAEHVRVGVFVDQMDEIHGVATMYRNLQLLAGRPRADELQVVYCGAGQAGSAGATGGAEEDPASVRLRPVASLPMPLYAGRTLGVPSLLDVLDHIAGAGYDVLHIATPGPLGLAALAAGITLGLPIVGAYHTEFGRYAEVLSGDAMVAELVELLVREFYGRCAVVAVPSATTAASLKARGYQIDRFEILKNGVDTDLFRPDRRDEALRETLGGGAGRTLILYAGRVSREKGLERLTVGYRALRARRDDVQLVVAGDGPYRADLEAALGGTATFTGFLRGEELARTVASCDVMAFPSTTDTLGRAVAEAQAAGLPAVVFGEGGPRECLRPGISGYVAEAGDEAGFWARIEELVDDPAGRARMGRAASAFALTLSWDNVLDGLIGLYRDICGVPPVADSADAAGPVAETAESGVVREVVLAGAG